LPLWTRRSSSRPPEAANFELWARFSRLREGSWARPLIPPDSFDRVNFWHRAGQPPAPKHTRKNLDSQRWVSCQRLSSGEILQILNSRVSSKFARLPEFKICSARPDGALQGLPPSSMFMSQHTPGAPRRTEPSHQQQSGRTAANSELFGDFSDSARAPGLDR
jgi:hypothetical protein